MRAFQVAVEDLEVLKHHLAAQDAGVFKVGISVGGWAVLQKTRDLAFFSFLRNVY